MGDAVSGIKMAQNNSQLGPSLYNALSATSGGFLNQREQQSTGGPPGSLGVGPSSPQSPSGDNMMTFDSQKQNTTGYAPSPQMPSLGGVQQTNPMVSQDPRALNQQPNPQLNSSPTMPGLFGALQPQGTQGQPTKQFNNQG